MNKNFKCIGIIGNLHYSDVVSNSIMLYKWLTQKGYAVIIEKRIAQQSNLKQINYGNLEDIGLKADLAIIIGGDGNMLGAARKLSRYNIKLIGINRGKLGFLTDLNPANIKQELNNILQGNYFVDKRFLLETKIYNKKKIIKISHAINEVVVHPKKIAHMIEFEVYINNDFAFSQRSDGMIISTPTGSTAYSLSAGGPILMPALDAMILVPMFPHTLSARPLVINGNSIIKLRFSAAKQDLEISLDGQIILPLHNEENLLIYKSKNYLNLIHPNNYKYFDILSSKLGWSKKLF